MRDWLDGLLTFGRLASLILGNRRRDSLHRAFDDKQELLEHLARQRFADTAFLVKGSRGMRMDEVADFLRRALGEEG